MRVLFALTPLISTHRALGVGQWPIALSLVVSYPLPSLMFALFHEHSARLSLAVGNDTHLNGLTVDGDKIYVTMAERTGNLWLGSWQ